MKQRYLALIGELFLLTSLQGTVHSQSAQSAVPSSAVAVLPSSRTIDPRSYGAKGDGATYDTLSLQKAIDACGGTGGRVVLKPGSYLSAQLTLRAGMTLHLDKGAVLLGGTNAVDYPVLMPDKTSATAIRRSLLFADKADGLVIEGEGEIDGRGQSVQMFGKESERPSLIRIFSSKDVTIRDITLRNPRMWTQVYCECSHLLLDHLTVIAPPYCPNLDGMDICDSHDVIIRNCDVASEDDSICLKSHGQAGLQNIVVENNRVLSWHANAIKLGTATVGPISHLVFNNNLVTGARYGGLCIESVDGSVVKDIEVKGLDLYKVSQPVFIRLGHRDVHGSIGDLQQSNRPTGSIDGVLLQGIRAFGTADATKGPCSITGIPGAKVRNVTLKDCYFEMPGGMTNINLPALPPEREGDYPQSNMVGNTPAYGIFIRHAEGITLDHVFFGYHRPDARPWICEVDATVQTNNCGDLGLVESCDNPGLKASQ